MIFSRRSGVAFPPLHRSKINAIENQSKLFRVDRQRQVIRLGRRQLKPALFQAFVPDRQTVGIKIKHLHSVPQAIDEHKQRSGQHVGRTVELLFDQAAQAVETLAHVRRFVAQENRQRIREIQHDAAPARSDRGLANGCHQGRQNLDTDTDFCAVWKTGHGLRRQRRRHQAYKCRFSGNQIPTQLPTPGVERRRGQKLPAAER
jgi:hypothetical protein